MELMRGTHGVAAVKAAILDLLAARADLINGPAYEADA